MGVVKLKGLKIATYERHVLKFTMIIRQEADIAMMSFSLTAARQKVMDFSPPVEYSSVYNIHSCLSNLHSNP